jgi:hypothetical protein
MDHGIHRPFTHKLHEALGIGCVHHSQPLGRDVMTVASREIVHYGHVITAIEENSRRMGSDIAGATGDQDVFGGGCHLLIVVG